MPRPGVTPAFATAMAAKVIRPFLLFDLQFKSEGLYLWTGLYPLSWDGKTWEGSGKLLTVSGMSEDSEVNAKNVTLTLSGVPSTVLGYALTDIQRGLPAQVFLGLFDTDGKTIIANPVLAYAGRIDQPTLSDGGETCTISLNLENPLVDMNRPVDRRYTDADQQMDHPGDLGCGFVNSIQNFVSYFGQIPSSVNSN